MVNASLYRTLRRDYFGSPVRSVLTVLIAGVLIWCVALFWVWGFLGAVGALTGARAYGSIRHIAQSPLIIPALPRVHVSGRRPCSVAYRFTPLLNSSAFGGAALFPVAAPGLRI